MIQALLMWTLCCSQVADSTISIFDASIYYHYIPAQQGPLIVLQAGARAHSQSWQSLIPLLEEAGYGLLVYDRPGLGKSSSSQRPRDALHIAEELHELIQQLGINNNLILVGHSMGGIYQHVYAARYPNQIQALILLDSPHPDWEDALNGCLTVEQQVQRQSNLQRMRERAGETVFAEYAAANQNFILIQQGQITLTKVGLISGGNQSWPEEYGGQCLSQSWKQSQEAFQEIYPNLIHQFSTDSGHQIPFQDPKIILSLIKTFSM